MNLKSGAVIVGLSKETFNSQETVLEKMGKIISEEVPIDTIKEISEIELFVTSEKIFSVFFRDSESELFSFIRVGTNPGALSMETNEELAISKNSNFKKMGFKENEIRIFWKTGTVKPEGGSDPHFPFYRNN